MPARVERIIKKYYIALICVSMVFFSSLNVYAQDRTQDNGSGNKRTDSDYSGLKIHQTEIPVTAPKKIENLYSWSLRDAELYDVLLTFAKGSKTNIVIEPGVSGKVTMDLTQVKFEEVLDKLLTPLNFEYSREGSFIHVFKPRIKTKIFNLNYVNTPRSGSGSISGEGASVSSSTKMDFWATTIAALGTIVFEGTVTAAPGGDGSYNLDDKTGRRLIVNPTAGIVLVSAVENKLQEVEDFLKAMENACQRQVLIQAKIIEITLTDDLQMGINWGADMMSWSRLTPTLTGGTSFIQNLATSGGVQVGVSSEKTSFLLDALATKGNLNILSTPQAVTLNNQTAIIKVTQEDVYFEVTVTTDTETNISVESVSPKKVETGITLDVTPQISPDGVITLNIHPSVTDVTGYSNYGDDINVPIVAKRETNAVVKAKDGQTIVLAGLYKDRNEETINRVPCLGDIPYIGVLFRKTTQTKLKTELVVMLTPIILDDNNINLLNNYKNKSIKEHKKKLHLGLPPLSEGIEGELE